MAADGFKVCRECKQELPLAEFYVAERGDVCTSCKACYAKRHRDSVAAAPAARRWRQRNAERDKENKRRWKVANRSRATARENARQALKRNAYVEDVDRDVVLARDNGMCGICGKLVEGAWHLDHVIPLSRGGLHCYDNVQAAHPLCNIAKGAKLPSDLSDAA